MALRRIIGAVLLIVALVGVFASVAGAFLVNQIATAATTEVETALTTTIDTLETSQEVLELANTALDDAADAVNALSDSTIGVGATIQSTSSLLGSLSDLFGEELPLIITSTQTSLETAQEGVAVVERVLDTLADVPLIGVNYNPQVPLTQSIADIEDDLGALPPSFTEISEELSTTQQTLATVDSNLDDLNEALVEIETSFRDSQTLVSEYQELFAQITEQVTDLRDNAPVWINTARLGFTFVLVWLGFSQVGLAFQGWSMLTTDPRALEARVDTLEEYVQRIARHTIALEEVVEEEVLEDGSAPGGGT